MPGPAALFGFRLVRTTTTGRRNTNGVLLSSASEGAEMKRQGRETVVEVEVA